MSIKTKQPAVIPRRIRVGHKRYSIDIVESMLRKGDRARIYYDQQRIVMGKRSNLTGKPFTPNRFNHTFWHEVTHAILDAMQHPLRNDEQFVEQFSKNLYQVLRTAEFK